LNLYASFDLKTALDLPTCESKNIAPKEAFATDGALSSVPVSPGLEFRQSIVRETQQQAKSLVIWTFATLCSWTRIYLASRRKVSDQQFSR
jgi:hypothetical protein